MIKKQTNFSYLSHDDALAEIRKIRNSLLVQDIDSMNPMRWELLTPEEQDEYRAYRKRLLIVPDTMSTFNEVVWPQHPDFKVEPVVTEELTPDTPAE
jgi:hypothetical protein